MTDPADAMPTADAPAQPLAPASIDAAATGPGTFEERAARRAALRDLAAMIGVEVFY